MPYPANCSVLYLRFAKGFEIMHTAFSELAWVNLGFLLFEIFDYLK